MSEYPSNTNDLNYDIDEYNDIYDEDINEEENCVNCFFSDGKHCCIKNIHIDSKTRICWNWTDTITMRANTILQDEDLDY